MRFGLQILCFGEIEAMESILFAEGDPGKFRRIGCFAWLLQGKKNSILVDTGIKDVSVVNRTKKGPRGWTQTEDQRMENNLKLLGTHPDAVGKVILTHSHYDHISNIALFKNAEVYISAKEFEFLHSQSNEAGEHLSEAKEHLDRMDKAGKLFLVGNDLKVDDDIRIRWIGGHTPGSQMVFTDTVRGKFLITGDAVFLRENVTKRIPIGLTRDAGQSKNVIAVCGQFEGECLPSHDLSVLSFFKEG